MKCLAKTFSALVAMAPVALGAVAGLAVAPPGAHAAGSPDIVISQQYGGGGNTGATYKNDFVELFNRGTTTVNVTGWTVQYQSAAGTGVWQKTLLSGSIQAGQYYLVQEAPGTGGTLNLPTPDAIGSIAMSSSNGKLVVARDSVTLSGGCPSSSSIADLFGYGSATCFEGTVAAALSNTTSASRNNNGCTDTDNNLSDFTAGAPNPRNTASPKNTCVTTPVTPSTWGAVKALYR